MLWKKINGTRSIWKSKAEAYLQRLPTELCRVEIIACGSSKHQYDIWILRIDRFPSLNFVKRQHLQYPKTGQVSYLFRFFRYYQ
mmetsp:Transcript_27153/g.41618  ORF Transcript_27153/g.41618 Transcript_27153/m.41618 type:complete len:84 (+) Transcript_27153:1646-1897(+)